jgi:hypothetical protein
VVASSPTKTKRTDYAVFVVKMPRLERHTPTARSRHGLSQSHPHVVVTCFQASRTPPTRRGVVKELEAAGLIERIAIPTTPVQIHYRLAPDGQALVEALMPLARWSMRRSGSRGTGWLPAA